MTQKSTLLYSVLLYHKTKFDTGLDFHIGTQPQLNF